MSEACMMIKNSCHTVFYRINISSISGKLCLFQSQMTVNGPPLSVQDIQKSLRIVSFNTQSSGKGAVNMFMGIDKRRHDHSALCINKLCIRISFFYFFCSACHNDGASVHCHCTVFIKGIGRISCNHSSISNNLHIKSSLSCKNLPTVYKFHPVILGILYY